MENTALGRAGTPEDIADAVVFLCSPKASWLTGEVLDLNGGAHLKRYPDVLGHVMKLADAVRERSRGKQAIVTGAGSGIGAALCRALVARGRPSGLHRHRRRGRRAHRVAARASRARAARLDVTDAAAVQAAVDDVVDRAGRLDLMFNNAGIVWGGETELLTLDQWNAIIDVNIRGVVHGVAAAYPLMIRQGHGHIVNTASMAGLTAAGQITSYVTTKHAVVGLSLALRSEAAAQGVGVLVVCPAAVETPILDKGAVGGFAGRDYFLKAQGVQDRLRRRPAGPRHPARHRAQQGAAGQTDCARMRSGCSRGRLRC